MLVVRTTDLSRLHDARRRSGCAAPSARASGRRSRRSAPPPRRRQMTMALIAINVLVFIAESAGGAPLGGGGGGTIYNHGAAVRPADRTSARVLADRHLRLPPRRAGASVREHAVAVFRRHGARAGDRAASTSPPSTSPRCSTGSFGALLFQPTAPTVGASGAIFGIFGALIIVARARGISIWQSGLGFWLILNLVFSLSFRGSRSAATSAGWSAA